MGNKDLIDRPNRPRLEIINMLEVECVYDSGIGRSGVFPRLKDFHQQNEHDQSRPGAECG